MATEGMLISLTDRRRQLAAAVNATGPLPAARRTAGPRAPLIALAALLALAGGLALWARAPVPGVSRLPREIQSALLQQTLDQVRTICRQTSATIGELREHCLGEARFLLQFPACDENCHNSALAVLPRTRH